MIVLHPGHVGPAEKSSEFCAGAGGEWGYGSVEGRGVEGTYLAVRDGLEDGLALAAATPHDEWLGVLVALRV